MEHLAPHELLRFLEEEATMLRLMGSKVRNQLHCLQVEEELFSQRLQTLQKTSALAIKYGRDEQEPEEITEFTGEDEVEEEEQSAHVGQAPTDPHGSTEQEMLMKELGIEEDSETGIHRNVPDQERSSPPTPSVSPQGFNNGVQKKTGLTQEIARKEIEVEEHVEMEVDTEVFDRETTALPKPCVSPPKFNGSVQENTQEPKETVDDGIESNAEINHEQEGPEIYPVTRMAVDTEVFDQKMSPVPTPFVSLPKFSSSGRQKAQEPPEIADVGTETGLKIDNKQEEPDVCPVNSLVEEETQEPHETVDVGIENGPEINHEQEVLEVCPVTSLVEQKTQEPHEMVEVGIENGPEINHAQEAPEVGPVTTSVQEKTQEPEEIVDVRIENDVESNHQQEAPEVCPVSRIEVDMEVFYQETTLVPKPSVSPPKFNSSFQEKTQEPNEIVDVGIQHGLEINYEQEAPDVCPVTSLVEEKTQEPHEIVDIGVENGLEINHEQAALEACPVTSLVEVETQEPHGMADVGIETSLEINDEQVAPEVSPVTSLVKEKTQEPKEIVDVGIEDHVPSKHQQEAPETCPVTRMEIDKEVFYQETTLLPNEIADVGIDHGLEITYEQEAPDVCPVNSLVEEKTQEPKEIVDVGTEDPVLSKHQQEAPEACPVTRMEIDTEVFYQETTSLLKPSVSPPKFNSAVQDKTQEPDEIVDVGIKNGLETNNEQEAPEVCPVTSFVEEKTQKRHEVVDVGIENGQEINHEQEAPEVCPVTRLVIEKTQDPREIVYAEIKTGLEINHGQEAPEVARVTSSTQERTQEPKEIVNIGIEKDVEISHEQEAPEVFPVTRLEVDTEVFHQETSSLPKDSLSPPKFNSSVQEKIQDPKENVNVGIEEDVEINHEQEVAEVCPVTRLEVDTEVFDQETSSLPQSSVSPLKFDSSVQGKAQEPKEIVDVGIKNDVETNHEAGAPEVCPVISSIQESATGGQAGAVTHLEIVNNPNINHAQEVPQVCPSTGYLGQRTAEGQEASETIGVSIENNLEINPELEAPQVLPVTSPVSFFESPLPTIAKRKRSSKNHEQEASQGHPVNTSVNFSETPLPLTTKRKRSSKQFEQEVLQIRPIIKQVKVTENPPPTKILPKRASRRPARFDDYQ